MVKFQIVNEIGIVTAAEGMRATVSIPRKTVCEGCSLDVCKPEEDTMKVDALNLAGARVGQKVRVVLKSRSYLAGAVIVYGIPALALILGALAASLFFKNGFNGFGPEVLPAIFGCSAFVLSFFLVRIWSGRAGNDEKPVLEEVLEDA